MFNKKRSESKFTLRPKTQTMLKNKYLTPKKLPKSAVREKKGQVRYGNYMCINEIRGGYSLAL